MTSQLRLALVPWTQPSNVLGSSRSNNNNNNNDNKASSAIKPGQFEDALSPSKENQLPSSSYKTLPPETPRLPLQPKGRLDFLLLAAEQVVSPPPARTMMKPSSSYATKAAMPPPILDEMTRSSMKTGQLYNVESKNKVGTINDDGGAEGSGDDAEDASVQSEDISSSQEDEEDSDGTDSSTTMSEEMYEFEETILVVRDGRAFYTKHRKTSKSIAALRSTVVTPSATLSEYSDTKEISTTKGNRVTWSDRLEHLKDYRKTHGTCEVPVRKGDANYSLGRWLVNQRSKFKFGELDDEKVKQLRALGCSGFSKTKKTSGSKGNNQGRKRAALEDSSEAFTKKKRRNALEESLAPVKTQRAVSRSPKTAVVAEKSAIITPRSKTKETPSPAAAKKRVRVGGTKKICITWEERKVMLQDYKKEFGNLEITTNRKKPFGELGLWLAAQRSLYRKDDLKEERLTFLRGIGCPGFGAEN